MRSWILAAAALMTTTGCSSMVLLGPRAYDRERDQDCVEHALRHDPDAGALAGAEKRFAKACAHGDPAGCSTLGVMTELGLGTIAKDEGRAFELYDEACRGGNPQGCTHLGVALRHGRGAALDLGQARKVLTLACEELKHGLACTELGELEVVAGTSAPERLEGVGRMQISCVAGDGDACFRLGRAFALGILGPDPLRAEELYQTACQLGEAAGCDGLDALYAKARIGRPPAPSAANVAAAD